MEPIAPAFEMLPWACEAGANEAGTPDRFDQSTLGLEPEVTRPYWSTVTDVYVPAAAPLVARLRTAHPEATILLTHITATGRDVGRELFGDTVVQAWLPYDARATVRRFLHQLSAMTSTSDNWA